MANSETKTVDPLSLKKGSVNLWRSGTPWERRGVRSPCSDFARNHRNRLRLLRFGPLALPNTKIYWLASKAFSRRIGITATVAIPDVYPRRTNDRPKTHKPPRDAGGGPSSTPNPQEFIGGFERLAIATRPSRIRRSRGGENPGWVKWSQARRAE